MTGLSLSSKMTEEVRIQTYRNIIRQEDLPVTHSYKTLHEIWKDTASGIKDRRRIYVYLIKSKSDSNKGELA